MTENILLNDVARIIDCEHKTAPLVDEGYPSIRTPNIGKGRLILEGVNQVSEKTYQLWSKRAEPEAGDIILAREAPVGNAAIIPRNLKLCLGQRTVLIKPNKNKINPEYLNYLINSDAVNSYLLNISTGATVGHLNVMDIRKLKLPNLPSISLQRKIAAILTAYDDLIEINNRRIQILEKMAEEIYREWFVRNRLLKNKNIRYDKQPLRNFIEYYIGGGWGSEIKGAKENHMVYVIRGTDFDELQFGAIDNIPSRFISDGSLQGRKLKPGDIIMENSVNHQSRTTGKSILITQDLLNLFDGDVICASFCKLIRPKNIYYSKLLSLNFKVLFGLGLMDYFQNIATNGIANLQIERFLDKNFIVTSKNIDLEILNTFDSTKYALIIQGLIKTRDLLLPRLISGKLSVENLDIKFPPSMEEANA